MDRIHVSVRARPISPEDAGASPWRISGNTIFTSNQSVKYDFDQIFGEECNTRAIYECRTKSIVAAAVGGFNGTVFAYGQTSSGKTYTMRGSRTEPGVIPLAVRELFVIIQEDVHREFLLRMSYMEIYNEEINDLLAPEHRKLQIHESLERGIFVAGLREEIVSSPEQVLDLMEFGESHRHIGETNMNIYSSRSHTIFRMIIESRNRVEDGDAGVSCDAVRVSVLNLVDLAGSERAAKTGAEGMRLKEGSHINKSLMTLGTVINKLSEGVENQGGHVPYRDSKLTRILQSALGGNANTGIICNITLSQVHADETRSTLQFASRASRVTNCAHVNEILTDAALLKRQKKEIEELRAKLLGLNAEHLEKEILNLRNILLQTEVERERIALELQEEKKAQALRDRRLQQQAKQIANLSSIVLNTHRDVNDYQPRKNKRRETWCPTALARESPNLVVSSVPLEEYVKEPLKTMRNTGSMLSFEELVKENEINTSGEPHETQESYENNNSSDDYNFPSPQLMNITNRRKPPPKKKSSIVGNLELIDLQREYENLLMEFLTQATVKDIEIECLRKEIAKSGFCLCCKDCISSMFHTNMGSVPCGVKGLTMRESGAIVVIKQLQEQIKEIEKEKASIEANLDDVVQLATKQNTLASEKYDKLYQEVRIAQEEAQVAHEQLNSFSPTGFSDDVEVNFLSKFATEFQEIELEVQQSKEVTNSISSLVDELLQQCSFMLSTFLDMKALTCARLKLASSHDEIYNSMSKMVAELEMEKSILHNESIDHLKQIEALNKEAQKLDNACVELHDQKELEIKELVSQIHILQREVSSLSTSSLAREKESLRKDLEKTKVKLKDMETKFKNCSQDKIKLESEKACTEKEIKLLLSQRTLLERDINKRESAADRQRDSQAEKRHVTRDFSKTITQNNVGEQSLQLTGMELEKAYTDLEILSVEYQKLEVCAIEMEEKIALLEANLLSTSRVKEDALAKNESLTVEIEAMSHELTSTKSELSLLQEEISAMSLQLNESEALCQVMGSSVKCLSREKEEMAVQLVHALLELEEEKIIWSAKEKASIASIIENTKQSESKIVSLSKDLVEVTRKLELSREESKVLMGKLATYEKNAKYDKLCSMEKSNEVDRLRFDLPKCQTEREDDTAKFSKEKAELVATLESTQAKLDTYRRRYHQALDEIKYMNSKYNEASRELKEKLAFAGHEILRLKKLLIEGNPS